MERISRAALSLAVILLMSLGASAAERKISAAKKKLIRELLRVTEAQEGTADAIIDILGGRLGLPLATEVQRGEVRESEQVAEIVEETQLELYDRYFTEKQLRDLTTFFKTKTGRRYVEVARTIAAETRKNLRAAMERYQSQTTEAARRDRSRNDLQLIGLALSAYFRDQAAYPRAQTIEEMAALLVPKYAPVMPQQDAWGHSFRYEVSADGLHYRVVSAGGDGKLANADDIVLTDSGLRP